MSEVGMSREGGRGWGRGLISVGKIGQCRNIVGMKAVLYPCIAIICYKRIS